MEMKALGDHDGFTSRRLRRRGSLDSELRASMPTMKPRS